MERTFPFTATTAVSLRSLANGTLGLAAYLAVLAEYVAGLHWTKVRTLHKLHKKTPGVGIMMDIGGASQGKLVCTRDLTDAPTTPCLLPRYCPTAVIAGQSSPL